MKRIYTIGAISGAAAFAIWRLREQGRLETTFLEFGVDQDTAQQATDQLIPFWSLTTYGDTVGNYAPSSPEEWGEYAAAAAGQGLVLL